MAERTAQAIRLLAAELDAEMERIDCTVGEIEVALRELEEPGASRVALYGAAALLEIFHRGVEKVLVRIAKCFGTLPEGPSWHRELLETSTLDLPKIRPVVLTAGNAKALDPYLSFRHQFRNLYLFDLDIDLTRPLLLRANIVWAETFADLKRFSDTLLAMAEMLDEK